jgi:hypothetical protein
MNGIKLIGSLYFPNIILYRIRLITAFPTRLKLAKFRKD